MNEWMGSMYYRGIDPIHKGYAELKYWHKWHEVISDAAIPPKDIK